MPQIYHPSYRRSTSPSPEIHHNDRPQSYPHPTNADDTIVLSDLLRTGEASRLRRRGAMRLDNSAHPTVNPGTEVTVMDTPWHYDEHEQEHEQGTRRAYPPRRRNAFPVPRRTASEESDEELELEYRYTLVCGGIDPAAEGELEEEWDEAPFKPSVLPLYPSATSSSSTSAQRRRKTNGCGAVLHMYAAPVSSGINGRGEWTASQIGVSSETVQPLDGDYFPPGVTAQFMRNTCGCVREGVGCSVCGNLLGIRYSPCSASLTTSSTGNVRHPRPHLTKPSGPLYWSGFPQSSPSSSSSSSSSSDGSAFSSNASSQTTYAFFSTAVTSYPSYSFPSSPSPSSFPPAIVYPNAIDSLFIPSGSSASQSSSPIYDSEAATHLQVESIHEAPTGWHGGWGGRRSSRWGTTGEGWGPWADGASRWDINESTVENEEATPGVRIEGGVGMTARVNVRSRSADAEENQQQERSEEPPTPIAVPTATPQTANEASTNADSMEYLDYFRELYATSRAGGNSDATLHPDAGRNTPPPTILTHLLTASPSPIAPSTLPGASQADQDSLHTSSTEEAANASREHFENSLMEDPPTEDEIVDAIRHFFASGRRQQPPAENVDSEERRLSARLRGGSSDTSGAAAEFYQLPAAEAQFLLEWGADELLGFNGSVASANVNAPSTSPATVRLPSGVGLGLGLGNVSGGGFDGPERMDNGQFERLGLERLDGLELSRVNQLEIQGLNELDSEEDAETVFTSSDSEEEAERAWGPIPLHGGMEMRFDADGDAYVVRREERHRSSGTEKEGASSSVSSRPGRYFWVER